VDWQAALLARIRADSDVTALVAAKSYWEQPPQNTPLPYVTLLDVTSSRPQTLKGFDLEASRVQIDVWAGKYADKQAIMEAVLAALVPSKVRAGHRFQRAEIALGPRDVAGERDGTNPIFRKSADLIFHHTTAD
jgi:hypothetical protein